MSKPVHSIEEWREIFRQQQASGLPATVFCRQQRVPQASFYAWRRKLRDAGSRRKLRKSTGFAEVKVAPVSALGVRGVPLAEDDAGGSEHHPGGIELRLAGQRSIVVRPGFDPPTLRQLLATLETAGANATSKEAGG
jgi:hypothetical protein